jgi:signal transduction histidine kinase
MLDNLIENALRYSRAGGRVTIGWRADGKRVRIGVEDEGRGIDESERERVFERFYRGSASRGREEGTGLGLNVVEALAGRWAARRRSPTEPAEARARRSCCPRTAPYPPLTRSSTRPYRAVARVEA